MAKSGLSIIKSAGTDREYTEVGIGPLQKKERKPQKDDLRRQSRELEKQIKQLTLDLEQTKENLKQESIKRKTARSLLKINETHLAASQRMAKLGSWIWFAETKTIEWSNEMFTIFQIKREDLYKDPAVVRKRVHPDDLDCYLKAVGGSLEHNNPLPCSLEFRLLLPDGKIRYIVSISTPWQDGDTPDGRIIGIIQDVTERKIADHRTTDSLRYNRAIVEYSPVGMITCTASGNVISANSAIAQLMGRTIQDLLSQNLFRLDFWKTTGLHAAAEKALTSNSNIRLEARTVSASGKDLTVDTRFIPFDYKNGQRLLVLFTDISERIRNHESLLQLQKELRSLAAHLQVVREREIQRLAREFHDRLSQTMTVLKMNLALLMRKILDEKQPLQRQIIADELKAAGILIDDITRAVWETIADLRPQMLDDLGFVTAVEWEAERFEARTGIPCKFKTFSKNIQLNPAVSIALFRICQEGLSNIIRYAGAGSVTLELINTDNQLVFIIKDDGCGILYEDKVKSGSFGLLGMRERSIAIGGSFHIRGCPGQGTTLTVCFPWKEDSKVKGQYHD